MGIQITRVALSLLAVFGLATAIAAETFQPQTATTATATATANSRTVFKDAVTGERRAPTAAELDALRRQNNPNQNKSTTSGQTEKLDNGFTLYRPSQSQRHWRQKVIHTEDHSHYQCEQNSPAHSHATGDQ